jgi:hypothetical protein
MPIAGGQEGGGGDRADRVAHRADQAQPRGERAPRQQPRHRGRHERPGPADEQAAADDHDDRQRDEQRVGAGPERLGGDRAPGQCQRGDERARHDDHVDPAPGGPG